MKVAEFLVFIFFVSNFKIKADTPANCMIYDLHGVWNIYIYSGGHKSNLTCKNPGKGELKEKN